MNKFERTIYINTNKVANWASDIKRCTDKSCESCSIIFNKDNTINELVERNKTLRDALNQGCENEKDIFERGKAKGMEEIWKALLDTYKGRSLSDNEKIFRYRTVGEILESLSPIQFMNKFHEYKENEAHNIKIGDEVVLITSLVSDDSVCGIVYDIVEVAKDSKHYRMISSTQSTSYTFSDKTITNGSVRKTGKHFDSIPFDYIA